MLYPQIKIGGLPINLVLFRGTAQVAFVVVRDFKTIFDQSTDKIDAYFDTSGFSIGEKEFVYNTAYKYKEIPELLEWLKVQSLTI